MKKNEHNTPPTTNSDEVIGGITMLSFFLFWLVILPFLLGALSELCG
jgi:hypothetical protein